MRASSHYARSRAQGLNAPACLPLPGRSIPAQGPCRLAEVRRRPPEEDCAGRGDLGKERLPLAGAGRPRGTLGGRGTRGGLIQGTCGQAGRAGAAQSEAGRVRALAESRPPLLPGRPAQPRFLRTEPGDPSSAGCPRQPPPLPGRLPLVTLSPPPAPQPPTGMENTSRGRGGRGHASLKGSLP